MQQVPAFWVPACSICFNLLCVFSILFYCVNAMARRRTPYLRGTEGDVAQRFMSHTPPALGSLARSLLQRESFDIKEELAESWQLRRLFSSPGMGKAPAPDLGVRHGENINAGTGKPCYVPKGTNHTAAGPPPSSVGIRNNSKCGKLIEKKPKQNRGRERSHKTVSSMRCE